MNDDKSQDNGVVNTNHNQDPATDRLHTLSNRGLNAATGGRWNQVRNAPIVGNAARKVEDNIANKLGNTKLGKKINQPNNHQRPDLGVAPKENTNQEADPTNKTPNANNNDKGSQNLRKSLANRAKNMWNQRRKKKKEENDSSDSNTGSENENSEEENSETEEKSESSTKTKAKRVLIRRAIMFGLIALGVYIILMIILSIITGGHVFDAPLTSYKTYGTDEYESLIDKNSKQYEYEQNYYKKMKEIDEDKGSEISLNVLNAILLNLYYEHDFQVENEELADSLGIDYKNMTDNASKFADLLVSFNSTDYAKNGEVYNALKNSDEFKEYYKKALEEKDIDEILSNIFIVSQELDKMDMDDETVVTSETKVNVVETKTDPKTSNVTQTKTMTINDYISGSIYANAKDLNNSELVKAYTIAYSTNIVAANKNLSINSNNASIIGQTCSINNGCSYDSNGNLVDGKGERNSQNAIYYNGAYYYKKPLTSDEAKALTTDINSVFGNVLVNKDGTYPTLDTSRLAGLGDGDYKSVLSQTYGDLTYKNVGENSYILDGNYGTKKVLTPVIFYDQTDYSKNSFCGLRKSTIAGSGCGVTSMAIVASTYENNRKYDPIFMNQEARKKGACSSSGTAQNFFQKEAATFHYKYLGGTKFNKSLLNAVLKHLSQGHLVVVRVLSGHFTSGGHYMVLGGVDPDTKKVYVYDPYNRVNKSYRKTGNGWYSFNDIIVKEAYNFYIIWKG